MNVSLKALCATSSFLVVAGLSLAEDAQQLRYKFPKGTPQYYRSTSTIDQTQTVADQKIKTTIKQVEVSTRALKNVDKKGNFHVETRVNQINVKVSIGPLGDYEYDSKKKDNDEASMLGAALTPVYDLVNGSKLTLVVGPRGDVKEVKGYKELFGDVFKDNPLGQQFAGGGTEEAARLQSGELYPTLPKKAIRTGDTWESPFDLEIPKIGKATGKKNFTLDGPGKVGKRKTLKFSTTMEMSFDVKIKMDGADVKGNLAITNSSGTIHFDPVSGQVVTMETKYTLSGNLTVTAGGKDIPVQTDQTQTVKLELLDKLPK